MGHIYRKNKCLTSRNWIQGWDPFPECLLTGCLSQHSLRTGRIFLCTTTSCRSSREGCWPISSSNGSMYSPTVPEVRQGVHKMKKKQKTFFKSKSNKSHFNLYWYFWLTIIINESAGLWLTINLCATWQQLPKHQTHGVHVYSQEGVSLKVDCPLQHLWSHVTPRTHL